MKKAILLYWPKSGNVEGVTEIFKNKFNDGELDVYPIDSVDKKMLTGYDNWIVGGSTVGSHVWEDADDSNKWHDFFKMLDDIDLSNKTVAAFGLGDQVLYPQHFVDGLGVFKEEFEKRGARLTGEWPTDGYNYTESEGAKGELFFGLALDEDNQDELTEARIEEWLETIKKEF
jgi:flavodoxin I